MHKKALKIFQISSFLLMSIHPLISLLCNLFRILIPKKEKIIPTAITFKERKMKDKKQTTENRVNIPNERPVGDNVSIPGINTPGIELPAFNPPIPNRAWTAMRNGVDIDALTPEERRDLYLGRDNI